MKFRGAYAHSVDDKGRLIIPQKFRLLLGERFVITKGFNRCLWVFPDEEFRELDKRLNSRPILDPDAVRLQRFFSAGAFDGMADSQGRVALPAELRSYAGIERETVIVGAGMRIEIWSKVSWDEMNESLSDDDIASSAKAMGIG